MLVKTERAGNHVSAVRGDPEFPVNRGLLCIKGAESAKMLTRSDRLSSPLLRDSLGVLREASWDEALGYIADQFARLRANYGSNAVAAFGSGGLTNEKAYALGKFARIALNTAHIDYNGRYCMSSAAAAQNRALGLDRGLPFPIADIVLADCVVSWGSNWSETMPPIRQWFDLQRERGGRLIVVDPRKSDTASLADLHIQPLPGTDLALANGLLYLVIESRAVDLDYIARRTSGFEATRKVVQWYSPDRVERITGVSEVLQRRMVEWMTERPRTLLLSGRGAEQQSKGVDTVHSFINLMLALGMIGTPGAGYACLTGQGNGQGGREHGQKADQLPGYRLIENSAHRAEVAAAWGVEADSIPRKGKSAFEILDSLGPATAEGGEIRALLVMGSNVLVASPNATRVQKRLRQLDILVVIDSFLNETAELAHVVLPTLLWTEESGTMTNLEGRIVLRRSITQPPPGPRSDLAILRDLSVRLGAPHTLSSESPSVVFDELAAVTAGAPADYSGISHARLSQGEAIQWPCPSAQHPGTAHVFTEKFGHTDGKARFCPVEHRDAAELPDQEFPLYFTTGRSREHYNSGAQTRGIEPLMSRRPEPLLEIHPSCLTRFGLVGESHAIVETRRASLIVRLLVTRTIRIDTIFLPFHYGGKQSANRLTVSELDPVSRMPEFKICAARLRKLEVS
jgi:assimilatory nitrate reductase catalytic subunit